MQDSAGCGERRRSILSHVGDTRIYCTSGYRPELDLQIHASYERSKSLSSGTIVLRKYLMGVCLNGLVYSSSIRGYLMFAFASLISFQVIQRCFTKSSRYFFAYKIILVSFYIANPSWQPPEMPSSRSRSARVNYPVLSSMSP